jgi:acetyl esterase/lipase
MGEAVRQDGGLIPVRAARLACTILMAAVASAAAVSHAAAAPMSYGQFKQLAQPKAQLRIPYGPGPSQFGELWLPDRPGRRPVVVMIHGGCWTASMADLGTMNLAAEDLADRGVAVWNIEYRRLGEPGGGYPGAFQDVAAAIDHLRVLAPKYRLDLRNLAAVGHSAGGHLALWAAARPGLPASSPLRTPRPLPIRGVVSVAGLADLEALQAAPGSHGCGPEPIASLVGQASAARPDVFADTSPGAMRSSALRQISIHGRLDRIAPVAVGEGYTARARARGERAELSVEAEAGHFELITPGTPAWDGIAARILQLVG